MFGGLVLIALFVQYCASKPVEYEGYPEENRNLNDPLLFEGDMLITPYQKKLALSGGDVSMAAAGEKRGATTLPTWPGGIIPYTIRPELNAYRNDIESAMRIWENNTCITFVPWTNESHVLNITAKPGCSCVVGFLPSPTGVCQMNLGPTCHFERVYLHELGHAIGFWHEQSRPDRDHYVKINYANIELDFIPNFIKRPDMLIQSFGSDYDYRSIMHYGPEQFTKAVGLKTIEPIGGNVVLKLNTVLSSSDVEQANMLYGCQTTSSITI